MTIVTTIKGDLLDLFEKDCFDAIVHGCNCYHTMGAGVAGQIAAKYPQAFAMDKITPYGSKDKLGSWSYFNTPHGGIINAYTQHLPGKEIAAFLYIHIRNIFTKLNESGLANERGGYIGIPMIGSGIAGGNWNTIKGIIDEVTPKIDIIVVEYQSTK